MPISPKEAAFARRGQSAAVVEHFCRKIDSYLSTNEANTNHEWWFAAGGMSSEVRQLVMEKYSAVGWRVRIATDPRDGDALVFRHPEPER